jgi:hypothetical protein
MLLPIDKLSMQRLNIDYILKINVRNFILLNVNIYNMKEREEGSFG